MAESATADNGTDQTRPVGEGVGTAGTDPALSTHESGPRDLGSPDGTVEVLAVGTKVGRYIVVDKLGAGAMGIVYAAYDPKLDRKVALKLLLPQQGGGDQARRTARLEREAQAVAKLSHPNVVGIFDVVVHEDRVVLAMEYLGGGTLRDWIAAKKRPWREILKMFIEVGKGLAAAHGEGQIHRDFKPDNVLLDKNGVPKVVDFGLVRLTSMAGSTTNSADGDTEETGDLGGASVPAVAGPAGLTRTGALAGTPAYMAPEQFLGKPIDARTDQFAFCVALYEALYGERPFSGETVIALAESVTRGRIRETPKNGEVPTWIRQIISRGLASNSLDRWLSMVDVTAMLGNDPAVKLRRRIILGGGIAVILTTVLGARQMVQGKRIEAEREIAGHLEDGKRAVTDARAKAVTARDLRTRAFSAFDALDKERGESLWRQTRALLPAIDHSYDQAAQAFDQAFTLDQSRGEIRSRLADVRYEHLLFADDFRLDSKAQVLQERLANVDPDGARRKRLFAPGSLSLRTSPVTSKVVLERYEREPITGRRSPKPVGPVHAAQSEIELAPGSYRLVLEGAGLAHVLYPFEVHPGERVEVNLSLPPASSIPEGFVYVPPGESWFGDADEQLRTQFLGTVPIHRRRGDAYLIARRETTYGEWIAFLDGLPPLERAKHAPAIATALRGSLHLRETEGGWRLHLQPGSKQYSSSVGEPISYAGRREHASQDWLQFPVAGVSVADAELYASWLHTERKVPGARLCSEVEWERAARGADDRLYPHGDEIDPVDANFDATYGHVDSAFGPDEVGSHPLSRSPFGVDDLAGNVFELARSSEDLNQVVIRGGAYYFNPMTCRSTNREVVPETFRDATTGFRICASFSKSEGTH